MVKKVMFQTIFRIPLVIWAIVVIYPILWMFIGAFKQYGEIFRSPCALPESWQFGNFAQAWTGYNIGTSFFNSWFVTALGALLCVFFALPTAYAIVRIRFKGSKILFSIYLASMMIPMVLAWIPLFFLLRDLNLIDNLFALALIYSVTQVPFTIFILASFLQTVPKD